MDKIESKVGKISKSDVQVYQFLSDFNNFKSLIPEDKIKNWIATSDSCQFTVDGIGDAALKIIEKTPNSLIKIASEGKTPVGFHLWIQLKYIDENQTAIRVVIEPHVNMMMMLMLKEPLQGFIDMLIDQAEKLNLG